MLAPGENLVAVIRRPRRFITNIAEDADSHAFFLPRMLRICCAPSEIIRCEAQSIDCQRENIHFGLSHNCSVVQGCFRSVTVFADVNSNLCVYFRVLTELP
jgi:hypothetical protein